MKNNKMHLLSKAVLAFALLMFASCSNSVLQEQEAGKEAIKFAPVMYELTERTCDKIDKKHALYVTDFVNIKNFKNKSQLGFLLSSELKVSLFDACSDELKIKEVEFRESVKLGKKGINVLSRSTKAIKTKYILKNHQVLVGTYSITNQQLILYLKLVDFDSGNTLMSSRIDVRLSDEIKALEGILPPKPKYYSEQKHNIIF